MNFKIEHDISASREAVIDALMNPAYYTYLGSKVANIHPPELLAATDIEGVCKIDVRYSFAGTLSGPARMAVDPAKLTWVIHTELSRETGEGVLTMTPDHYAGLLTCGATMVLKETPTGCSELLEGDLAVHLPLIGQTAEVAIVQGLRNHLSDEARTISEFSQKPPK